MTDERNTNRTDPETGEPRGLVLEIQRMSTEDGPGLRTTVFLKGCSLRCRWCHNPESIRTARETQWLGVHCIGCRLCVETCPEGALSFSESEGVAILRDRCKGCGLCAEECPGGALETLGTWWTPEALAEEVAKDRAYFGADGGVTASGGEAALQATFTARFFEACRKRGLRTALDTCGQAAAENYRRILPQTDLVLFDLKLADAERHREWTGAKNDLILKNLELVRDAVNAPGGPKELWIRTPIIPGATDDPANIRELARIVSDVAGRAVTRWELCAFNNLCRDKYERLGLTWDFADAPLLSAADMERLADTARKNISRPGIVNWSGSTCTDDKDESSTGPDLRVLPGGGEREAENERTER